MRQRWVTSLQAGACSADFLSPHYLAEPRCWPARWKWTWGSRHIPGGRSTRRCNSVGSCGTTWCSPFSSHPQPLSPETWKSPREWSKWGFFCLRSSVWQMETTVYCQDYNNNVLIERGFVYLFVCLIIELHKTCVAGLSMTPGQLFHPSPLLPVIVDKLVWL